MIKGEKKRKNRSGSKSQGTVPAFLLKTYEILENPEYEDIVSWNKEGNAFIVKRINDFSEKVLPKYFKHNNFASFVRQLNMYDFHKSRHENNENEFRHKLFRRGQKHLLPEIKRKISDGRLYPTNQTGGGSRDFDMDKFKKEASHLSTELGAVKKHQTDLEKVTKVIYNQNTQLIKENKLLWNELTKNRDKYEKKIEKLMMFIFSIMHNTGSNQLGPSQERKALTDGEFSQKLGELASDPDQAKSFFNGNTNEPLPLLPDKKDQERFMQQMNNYFQSKGNEGTLDSLLDQIPGGNEEMFKNEPPSAIEDQNMDPNIIPINTMNEKARGKPRGRGRKVGPTGPVSLPSGLPDENEFKEVPTKQVKREEPRYNIPQNIFAAPEPINMLNTDSSDDALKRGLSGISLGLSRDPSFRENDIGYFRSPPLQQQKSSNDFLYPNQKPYNGKEDDYNLYNMNNFNTREEDKQLGGMAPPPKTDSQTEENIPTFSPYSFMNNTNQNAFNFGQSFDDTVYRS